MTERQSSHAEWGRTAEFDAVAENYYQQHKTNIAITGEDPEYFAEYKAADLAALIKARTLKVESVLDFGSGIGNSIPHFRKYLSDAKLTCADVSARSHDLARNRFPGRETFVLIDRVIPLPDASQDVAFSACVFHHIPHAEHAHWLAELRRVVRPGGLLAIYEHNPLNPLTVHAVNTCPFDANARLIYPTAMLRRAQAAGWSSARVAFRLFFPAALRALRPVEPHLSWLPLGAQYRVAAWRPRP